MLDHIGLAVAGYAESKRFFVRERDSTDLLDKAPRVRESPHAGDSDLRG